MRTSTLALLLTSTALASSVVVLAQTRPSVPRTMGVEEIRTGMRGYGLSVFRGTQPERFDIEVLDVLHNARPGMDMVLIRPTHRDLTRGITVAGMSGSPIYINDRLVGAYAYGWEYGTEPIAGLTPIANMEAEMHRAPRAPPGMLPGTSIPIPILPPGGVLEPGGRRQSALDRARVRALASRAPINTQYGALTPLAVPLSVAGMTDNAVRYLTDALEPFGIVPVQATGSGPANGQPPAGTPTHYENGGALAVAMISGDISSVTTGTVTSVQGNQVLAFGHPLMGLGEVALPTSIARVVWILANSRRSFKISEPVRELGALRQDRPFTVVVDEQAHAPEVPVHIRLVGNDRAVRNEWNVRLAYHRTVLPRLYTAVVGTVLETVAGDNSDVAWVTHAQVITQNHGTLTFTDHGVSADGPGGLAGASSSTSEAVERLTDNPFEQVMLAGVNVDVELHWARDFYYVRNIALSREEADPGQTVQLQVSLGQYNGPFIVRTIPIQIPRELAGRDVDIEVSPGGDTTPELAEPETITDLIRNLTTTFPEDALVVSMRMPGNGVLLRGRAVPNLPGSALDALRPAASTDGGEPFANVRRTVIPTGRIVLGRDRIRLHVRDVRE